LESIWDRFECQSGKSINSFSFNNKSKASERKGGIRIKQMHLHTLDLTKIEGNGEFPCPACGTTISPDDCAEESYTILDIKVHNQDLEGLTIRCNKCRNEILLTGFSMLQNLYGPISYLI
jgi:hypothetical protein